MRSSTDSPRPSVSRGIAAAAVASTVHTLSTTIQNNIIQQGWMLKKRRKKMQGFAKRYFTLDVDGALSYAISPNHQSRDQILLPLASISSSERHRSIVVDSGAATFHLRCLTPQDFSLWMNSFRMFVQVTGQQSLGEQGPRPLTRMSLSRRSLGSWNVGVNNSRVGLALNDMGQTLKELELLISELKEDERKKKASNPKKGKDSGPGNVLQPEEKGGLFGRFHRKPSGGEVPRVGEVLVPPSSAQPPASAPPSASKFPQSSSNDSISDRLAILVATLREQHAALTARAEGGVSTSLASTSEDVTNERAMSPEGRMSIRTMGSSANSIWYDAPDNIGAEEFPLYLDRDDEEEAEDSERAVAEAQLETGTESASQQERIVEDTDTDYSVPVTPTREREAPDLGASVKFEVIRRTRLPAPVSGDQISLFSILKKNVGKDLSTVAFPVSFNEPITILQKLAEDLEYTDLLTQAVASTDPIERICLVAAFAVSGYACTMLRASRKPFNPMLGETFEDTRMKFIAEKVSHNPPVMACHAEGDGWDYSSTSGGRNKFWGKSLEIIPIGTTHLKIGEDHYQWPKPSSFMRNLIGEKYLEHCGPMPITSNTGLTCNLEFKAAGFWGSTPNVVSGVIRSKNKVLARLEGTWHEGISQLLDNEGSHLRVLWKAHQFPPTAQQYYGFTSFAMTLNEITSDIEPYLPPTDSRFRPDQRALEEGRVDDADAEKLRVEELQRARRRAREAQGSTWKPKWFEKVDGRDGEDEWAYKGGYWEAREARDWASVGVEPLW